ncbi:MAG: hypothetical protein V3V35_09685 [Dehalococcoidia bacterium]
MTPQSSTIRFPSLEFFQAMQERMNQDQPKYRAIGVMDVHLGIRVQADDALGETRLYTLLFDGYRCAGVGEATDDAEPDLDFVLEGPYRSWKEMFQNIQEHGKADTKHTLNHLTMLDDPLRAVGPDQYRLDKLYRYNYSIQVFLEEATGLKTEFAS